jgi:hypothetical protein
MTYCTSKLTLHATDPHGITSKFTVNGLAHANKVLGEEAFALDDWRHVGEYVFDKEGGRNRAFVSPTREVTVLGSVIQPHERIRIEQSFKFSVEGYSDLFAAAGLKPVKSWSREGEYGKLLRHLTPVTESVGTLFSRTAQPGQYAPHTQIRRSCRTDAAEVTLTFPKLGTPQTIDKARPITPVDRPTGLMWGRGWCLLRCSQHTMI